MPAQIHYIARDYTDHTITFGIDGRRYEYWLNPSAAESIEHIAKRFSPSKALALAKRRAWKVEKVQV